PAEPKPAPPPSAPAAADPRPVIVAFGNSLTAGFGVDPGKSYPDFLQQEIDRRRYRSPLGNPGGRRAPTHERLARRHMVVAEKPAITILEFGGNDGLRGMPVANTRSNLDRMIETLHAAGSQVLLAGITLPPNYGPEYIRKFDGIYPALAKQWKLPLIPF